jgi:hypothetical protein
VTTSPPPSSSSAESPAAHKQATNGDAAQPCPGCAKPLPDGASRCPHCGLALGEHQRCPHCHAIAAVEPSPDARFVCAVCGGVRIPIEDATVSRSTGQIDLLKRATAAHSSRAIWRIVSIVVAAFGVVSALVLWLSMTFAHPPPVATLAAGLAVMVPFAFAIFAAQRSRACAAEFRSTFDKAWIAAATDIARARKGVLDAAALAKLTGVGETIADRLLARMSAESVLTSSVTAEGNLKYTLLDVGTIDASEEPPADGQVMGRPGSPPAGR